MDFSTRFIRGKKPIYHDYFYISLSYFLLLLISLHNYRGQKNGRRTIEQGQTNGRRKMFYTIKEKKKEIKILPIFQEPHIEEKNQLFPFNIVALLLGQCNIT